MRLDIENVSVTRGARTVVHGVTTAVGTGRVLGLLGPNGSGKSSLLRACFRGLRPSGGRVLLDGADLAGMSRRDIARNIAVMAQEPPDELGLTVAESVLLGRTPHHRGFAGDTTEDRDLAEHAMKLTGITHLAHRHVHALSGGEKQRVLLARAITQEANVLLLDEPTNHLDLSYRFELMHLVAGLGVTVVMALHELDLALGHCDRVLVLDGGHAVADGPPGEVLVPSLLRDVFHVDAARTVHPRTGRDHLLLSGAARSEEGTS
ncbi:ABC transporter ATP-binding protein [Myceligenerans xiligouense]|uniref:Iron complex transport system ATP-binding protein n=1 Tax=Myceligenerans xiligouense TaxID=253184 RepID=A0A3N4YIM7_9MICO|nr:ABC transporter ATP-binding protein [Myceligenerans xiligouense]RPF20623.1 iron complex transport system ATP-binding protein [Myceligenerans xiligouense]